MPLKADASDANTTDTDAPATPDTPVIPDGWVQVTCIEPDAISTGQRDLDLNVDLHYQPGDKIILPQACADSLKSKHLIAYLP